MPKILSQSGSSLADSYDVEGSIAGIDELISKDVNLVHEMGGTMFSERLTARIFSLAAVGIAQNAVFDVGLSMGAATARILSIAVVEGGTLGATVLRDVSVSVKSPAAVDDTDAPMFSWETADGSNVARLLIAGSVVNINLLTPTLAPYVPNLTVGSDQPGFASTLTLRGSTTAFGAGTVDITALVYVAFPIVRGLSSRGLPLPGW